MKSSYPRGLRTPAPRRRFLSGTGVVPLSLPLDGIDFRLWSGIQPAD